MTNKQAAYIKLTEFLKSARPTVEIDTGHGKQNVSVAFTRTQLLTPATFAPLIAATPPAMLADVQAAITEMQAKL